MKFEDLRRLFGEREYFDFSTLLQMGEEPREHVRMQVYRWVKTGKLVRLRRGLYLFAEPYRKRPVSAAEMAGVIYPPSYLSLQWALGFYGLIPEQVVTLTSVTTRQTNDFNNPLGNFVYRHLRAEHFREYRKVTVGGEAAWIGSPEKALLDFWYLESGPWTAARMREMRFQHFERVDTDRLESLAAQIFQSPRVESAVSWWRELAAAEEEGKDL